MFFSYSFSKGNHSFYKQHYKKLDKLFITGDFDGDGKIDTLFQRNFSRLNNSEIDSMPDYYIWDSIVRWFYKQKSDVCLTLNINNSDTLHLGVGQGLYCLINIGDNNHDGKDEVALVIDYCDLSRMNSCKIFTICNKKWTMLKQFNINEDAFDFTSHSMPDYSDIKEYLEKKQGKWYYKDLDDISAMKELRIMSCK